MLHFQTFIGGIFDTNAYLVQVPGGNILIDAPTGSSDWVADMAVRLDLLLITHGHVDHIDDAAKMKQRFRCKIAYHRDGIPLITDPEFFKDFGLLVLSVFISGRVFLLPLPIKIKRYAREHNQCSQSRFFRTLDDGVHAEDRADDHVNRLQPRISGAAIGPFGIGHLAA